MIFLISDYLDDKSSIELFNSRMSYRKMLKTFPKRYKKKKQLAIVKIISELTKFKGKIHSYIPNKCFYLEFDMGGWNETWLASYNFCDDVVNFRIKREEEWKLSMEHTRQFENDSVLLQAIQDYFLC